MPLTPSPQVPSAHQVWLGRDRELAELATGLEDLLAGRGGLFLITGEPGIGKTRLCDELARAAAARGVAVHWGRSWEAGGAPSYWPFVQVLRSMCRGLEAGALGGLVGVPGDELAELLPGTRDRFQFFDAIGTFVHAAAARAPQLLVLDDLHAADPSSLQLLHFLVRDLRAGPLLVVGTYRDAEARLSPEVGGTLAQIAREATMLPLRRLDRREVADFIAQATGSAPNQDRVDALHQQTEGIPLFLRERLRLQGSGVGQPDGIREVVRARLSLLTPIVRRTLEAAAVMGREFGLEALATLTETPDFEVRAQLGPAADAGIVEPLDPPARWRFTHVLLREDLYEDLAPDRRTALHRAAALELQRRTGEPALTEVAHHLLHAIPTVGVGEAADAALRAAQRAMELLAFEDASALLERTARLLEAAAGEERRLFEVLLGLGLARIQAADIQLGKDACLRAIGLARRLGDGELLARAVLGCAYEFTPGVRDLALIALLDEALAALPAGDGSLRARCMAQLAAERQPEPDTQPPIELARAAVAMARRIGDPATLRFALSSAGLAMVALADPTEQLACCQEALRLALAAGDRLVALRANLLMAGASWELGDRAGAKAHIRAHNALDSELRHERVRWLPSFLEAVTALWDGRFDDADRWYRQSEAILQGDESRGVSMLAFPVGLARAAERYQDAPGIEATLRSAFGALHQDLGNCIGEMLIAQLHGRAGDRQRTATQLAAVRAHPLFRDIREPSWLALLVEPCHLMGDVPLAERLYPALLPRAQRFLFLGPMGGYYDPPYSRDLGLLCQTLGRLDEAVAHLADAEARMVQTGQRSQLARVRYELAGVLLARDRAADRERAAALLEQARTLAEELGQSRLLQLLPDGAPARSSTDAAAPFALRREGDYWTVVSSAGTLRLRDSRGLQLLAQLVASPGQEFHVLQLVSPADEAGDPGDAGPVLDGEAVQSYRGRLLELREVLEEAEGFSDGSRADKARTEMDFLTTELARAVGLGGRERRVGGAAERARTTVQKRLRKVIRRIEDGLPELGKHLDQGIRTGAFCGYLPEGRPRGRRR